jgi:spore germination protein GerM
MGFVLFKQLRRLAYLVILAGFACFELIHLGFARRTFEFFMFEQDIVVVEGRMLPSSSALELDMERYVEEFLLGPVSLDLAPLFTKGTKLRSLLYRDGVIYADLSESAVLQVQGGRDVMQCLEVLDRDLKRNFPQASGVKLFIDGNEIIF